jgi:hypothetical protein
MIRNVAQQKPKINDDDPDFTQKVILSRQEWQSDSQNVHDSALLDGLRAQFLRVRDENVDINNVRLHDYKEAVNWLRLRYKDDAEKLSKINKVITFLNNNYKVSSDPDIYEQDILTTVWQRAYDIGNQANFNEIRDAIGDAVLDCVEGDHVVCMSGRTSKIWQALARVDKAADVGVLKSKQALRNEIYELSAKIVDDHVGTNGTASEALKEAYRRNENTEQVKEITEAMKKQIDDLRNNYSGKLSKEQLDLIIEECKAVV